LLEEFPDMREYADSAVPKPNGITAHLGDHDAFAGSRWQHHARVIVSLT
jgi:hypothetical protein